jgi:hypothetical protein
MPWTEDGDYVYDDTSNTDNTGNTDYYTPGINPGRDDTIADEYTYDSLGNLYKNGTLFRAVEQPGDALYTPGLPSVVPGIGDASGVASLLKKLFVNKDGTLDLRALGATGGALAGLLGANKSTTTPSGYQGKIPQYAAVRNMVTAPQAGKRPGAGGTRYGGDVSYMPKGSSPLGGGLAALVNSGAAGGTTAIGDPMTTDFRATPEQLARSAKAINPNQYAEAYARGGSTGRYLQGETDGMADEIPAKIGKDQPAALSHGEFVIPADVVSHLGNGNSDAGAQKLYSMMDKIREARTGTKKQGKEINPDKFMPGGSVQHYADGGITGLGSAANAGVTGTESNLSNWAGDYVTDMLGKGKALSEMPYQEYGGPLTAGASNLQNQAFHTAGNLSVPGSIGAAAQTAGDIAAKAQGMNYTPTAFSNQFNAPAAYTPTSGPQYDKLGAGNVSSNYQAPSAFSSSGLPQYNQLSANTVSSQFNAPSAYTASGMPQYNQVGTNTVQSGFESPTAYQAGTFGNQFQMPTQSASTDFTSKFQTPNQSAATNFTNQFQTPGQYQNTGFTSGTFGGEQAQQYMNPYLQASLNPQLAEARRQADITEQANKAAMTRAGAYGGGRSAILAAENQRNLGTNLANITGKGYDTAYTNAMSQFNQDQARNMQAQQASEQSKQFGAGQSMTAAQLIAQYGMSAQQAQEAARQFNQGQAMTAADLVARYGLSSQQATEAARQFNQGQAMTGAQSAAQYGLAGQQAGESSRQFGANLGLQAATTAGAQGLQAALANQQTGLTSSQANTNAALEAARQAESSKQFGSNLGLQAATTAGAQGLQALLANQQAGLTAGQGNINAALEAARQGESSRQYGYGQSAQQAQTAAQLGLQAQQANQSAGLTAGQGNINAAMEAARQGEASRQFGASQGMTAAQQAAQYGQAAQTAGEQSRQFGASQGLAGLNTALNAAQAQGNLGISSADLGLRNLQSQLAAGQQQRGIESEGIAADKAAFEEARANPYKMVQYQQSLLNGLPLAAQNINTAQPSTFQQMLSGAGGLAGLFGNKTSMTADDITAALRKAKLIS